MQSMMLKEFKRTYCKDILASAKAAQDIVPGIDFTYDTWTYEEDGQPLKAIEVEGALIPIRDILTLSDKDFTGLWPDAEHMVARKLYLENFIIIEGEEVLEMVRRQLVKSMDEIEKYSSVRLEEML